MTPEQVAADEEAREALDALVDRYWAWRTAAQDAAEREALAAGADPWAAWHAGRLVGAACFEARVRLEGEILAKRRAKVRAIDEQQYREAR